MAGRDGNALGTAIWIAMKATQTYDPALSEEEDAAGLAVWQAFGVAFYAYDSANTIVNPGTMNNPAGQAINIPSTAATGSPSAGATSAPEVIEGTGFLS